MLSVLLLLLLALMQVVALAMVFKTEARLAELEQTIVIAQRLAADEAEAVATGVKAALTATEVMGAGVAGVKTVHQTIADIPFGILEAIPATRATTKVVRGVHDAITSGVYGALSAVNRELGGRLEKRPHSGAPAKPAAEPTPVKPAADGKKPDEGG